MDKNKQKIAIAEACGYGPYEIYDRIDGVTYGSDMGRIGRTRLPDYLNDLNAMSEAEKVLTDDQLFVMSRWLQHSTRSTLVGVAVMTATASQRAEAFLKTLNKWEDSE